MHHVADATVEALVSPPEAEAAMADAFGRLAAGDAAMQARVRTEAGGVKLSTLGAVIPGQDAVGAKVYTTIAGRFSFVILLFSATTGAPLATFDAAAITRLRTAACSVLASRHLARASARTLAVLGLGTQGRAHSAAFAAAWPLHEVRVASPRATPADAEALQQALGAPVRLASIDEAVDGADLVVTATRAVEPLFDGARLAEGAYVAAVGSSLSTTRELDDTALRRAEVLAVEWREQTLREAGDFVRADPAALAATRVVELADLVAGRAPGRRDDRGITIYKSVGVGLQDIALAGLAWRKLQQG